MSKSASGTESGSKSKVSQKNGHKIIAEGTTGCIYYPAVPCKTAGIPDAEVKKMVMKLESLDNALKDRVLGDLIRKRMAKAPADLRKQWILPEPFVCKELTPPYPPCAQMDEVEEEGAVYIPYQTSEPLSPYMFGRKQLPSLQAFLKIMYSLLRAVKGLQDLYIYHQDIHPGNILVDSETWEIVLIDFGDAQVRIRVDQELMERDLLEIHEVLHAMELKQNVAKNQGFLHQLIEYILEQRRHGLDQVMNQFPVHLLS